MSADASIVLRPWEARDRDSVQRLLQLLATEAEVSSNDAPTYVAAQDEHVVGMVTLCVFRR